MGGGIIYFGQRHYGFFGFVLPGFGNAIVSVRSCTGSYNINIAIRTAVIALKNSHLRGVCLRGWGSEGEGGGGEPDRGIFADVNDNLRVRRRRRALNQRARRPETLDSRPLISRCTGAFKFRNDFTIASHTLHGRLTATTTRRPPSPPLPLPTHPSLQPNILRPIRKLLSIFCFVFLVPCFFPQIR